MPNASNHQLRAVPPTFEDLPSDIHDFDEDEVGPNPDFAEEEEELLEEDIEGEEEELEDANDALQSVIPPQAPPGLREISSLASWTVSSSKPGCGVAALRAPNTSLFWQSDGPQPHHLNIHFFKMVTIVGMQVYLNFDFDESYTPTLIRFAAGTGYNDLQEFSVMRFEQPKGWIPVDWEGVGDVGDGDDDEDGFPALRCMLVQVRVCENHQNGKDTHLRGFQIFARDAKSRGERAGPAKQPTIQAEESLVVRRKPKKAWDMGDWMEAPTIR